MRLLLLSDVHAHAAALERVLDDAGTGWDAAVVLGDVVGYGPDPVATLALLRGLPLAAAVAGNHEAMMFRLLDGEPVRAATDVVHSLKQHALALSEDDLGFLRSLELQVRTEGWAAVHGSPREPFAYLATREDAAHAARSMPRDLVLVGHTHVPAAFYAREGPWHEVRVEAPGRRWAIPQGAKAFVNPGSVGPARDGGAGASYAVLDLDAREVAWRRGV